MRHILISILCFLVLACLHYGPVKACTSFCFDTPDGPVFGCNLDLFIPGDGYVFINRRGIAKEGFQESTTGETARWVSEYGSVTFNVAGKEFPFGGMNEAGLVVAGMELLASELPDPDERVPLSVGTWVQYVLDTCGSIQEAIAVDATVRIEDSAPPNHYLVADETGNCAAIEWLDGHLVCHVGDSLPVRAMSNMRYERALAAYVRGGPRWWWSNPGQSAERFAGAAARNEHFDADRNTSAIDYAFETLSRIVVAKHTKWSIVYDIAKRKVWFGSARSPTGKNLSLHAFDLSCEAPVLMLDVNTSLEGNVEDAFLQYDHDINEALFRNLVDRYGIKVSPEFTADLMKLFESFDCVR